MAVSADNDEKLNEIESGHRKGVESGETAPKPGNQHCYLIKIRLFHPTRQ